MKKFGIYAFPLGIATVAAGILVSRFGRNLDSEAWGRAYTAMFHYRR